MSKTINENIISCKNQSNLAIDSLLNYFYQMSEITDATKTCQQVIKTTNLIDWSNTPYKLELYFLTDNLSRTLSKFNIFLAKYECCGRSNTVDIITVADFENTIIKQVNQLYYLFVKYSDPLEMIRGHHPKNFWTKNFGNKILVDKSEFVVSFQSILENSLEESYEAVDDMDLTKNNFISIFEFDCFLSLYGPLCVCYPRFVKQKKYISGNISKTAANIILRSKPIGSYLVRYSNSKPGSYDIVFIDTKRAVRHCILIALPGYGFKLINSDTIYKSLTDFLIAAKKKLIYPVLNN